MTTPIKPPGSGNALQYTEQLSQSAGAEGTAAPSPELSEIQRPAVQQAPAGEVALDAVRSIADGFRAGAIDSNLAIERLVERALSSPAAGKLSALQREQLEGLLRGALQDDPTLAVLIRDLERSI